MLILFRKLGGGRVSDNALVRNCGYLNPNFHFPGDQILADRGFTLKDDFAAHCQSELITPFFTRGQKQLPCDHVEKSRKTSKIRIHIERVIGLLRNRFKILKGTLNIQTIKSEADEHNSEEFANIDKIVISCAVLVNLENSIIFKD